MERMRIGLYHGSDSSARFDRRFCTGRCGNRLSHISHQSFYQVNPVQTEKLYSLALSYAGLTGRETVWDLCTWNQVEISLFLAQRAGKVYGVEIVPQAIKTLKSNAALNIITNASLFRGKSGGSLIL